MKRTAISKRVRFEIFKRDGFECQYCGATPPGALLHVDHIKPVAEGGGNEMDNLVTACLPCNLGKGAKSLKSVPQSLADKASDVAEREAQLLGLHEIMEGKRQRLENEVWQIVDALEGAPTETYNRRDLTSIRRFLEQLTFHDVLEAAEIAVSHYYGGRRFRYFCGICWKKIKGG